MKRSKYEIENRDDCLLKEQVHKVNMDEKTMKRKYRIYN